jgi:hypothetical protein
MTARQGFVSFLFKRGGEHVCVRNCKNTCMMMLLHCILRLSLLIISHFIRAFVFENAKHGERGKFINHHAWLLSFFKVTTMLLSRNNNKKISARIIRRRLHMSHVCEQREKRERGETVCMRFAPRSYTTCDATLNYLRRI